MGLNDGLDDQAFNETSEATEPLVDGTPFSQSRQDAEPNAQPLHVKIHMELNIPNHLIARAGLPVVFRRMKVFHEEKTFANITVTNSYAAILLQFVVVIFYIHLALRVLIDGPAKMLKPVLIISLLLLAYGVNKARHGHVAPGSDLLLTPLEYTRDVLQERAHQGLRAVTNIFVNMVVDAVRIAVSEGLMEVELE
jgi:hypothetical protein